MSNLLSVTEAAQLLGVFTKTIRRWENYQLSTINYQLLIKGGS